MKKLNPLVFSSFFICSLVLGFSISICGSSTPKKILIFSSEEFYRPSEIIVHRAIREAFAADPANRVAFFTEAQDNARISNDKYEEEYVNYLRRKYEGEKIDLIFVRASPGIRFLLKHQAKLFTGVPKIFITNDRRELAGLDLGSNITGVFGNIEFGPTLDLILQQQAATKKVVVVTGLAIQDQDYLEQAKKDFARFEGRVEIAYLSGLAIPDLQNQLSSLPPDNVCLFIAYGRDPAGNGYSIPDVMSIVGPSASVPIYAVADTAIGTGVVGGNMVSFDLMSRRAAEIGLQILDGKKPSDIPPQIVDSTPMFDWRQLRRWNISEQALPVGSVVRFKEPTAWEQYKWQIIGLVAFSILQTLMIGWLLLLWKRKKKAEHEALLSAALAQARHRRLDEVVANVPGIVWESRTAPAGNGRTTTFISDYVQKMMGYTVEESIKQVSELEFTILPEEERARVQHESDEVVVTGNEAVSEFQCLTKDGEVRWIENHIAPIVDGKNGIVGLRGVALDVTDRKLAEENARQAEEKDRAILSAIPDLMLLQTVDGVYLDCHANDQVELLAPPESFMGKNMREVLPPDLADQFSDSFARTKERGKPEKLEYTLELGGQTKWFETRMVRTGDKILSMVRDITDLKRTQLEAHEISGRLITAQEDERARLARELHDDACQNLALLSIELELLGRVPLTQAETIRSNISMLSARVGELSDDLRQMSHQLHPARLTRLGLGSALRGFCNEIESAHAVKVEFVEANVPATLPAATSLNVYRIVQESLQNVAKHSRATRASVTISAKDDVLRLSISDNGRGFDPNTAAPDGSLGLISMRERARLLHGELSIDSRPGSVTRINVAIPLGPI